LANMGMKKILAIGLIVVTVIGFLLVFYFFEQETVDVGGYSVIYHKNQCELNPQSYQVDLESLKRLPCLVRITWEQKIGPDTYQEYCYLPDRGVEKTRIIRRKN